jgi:hypothetical protein
MANLPLGTFARSSKHWQLESLRYSSQLDTGTTSTLASIYSLNNNANDGSSLAVWAILAYYSSPRGLMIAGPVYGLQLGGFASTPSQLKPDTRTVFGISTLNRNTSVGEPTVGMIWAADGKTWLTHGDIPLWILPAGWRLDVLPCEPIGLFDSGATSFVTFLFGPYLPALTTPARPAAPIKRPPPRKGK